MNVVKNQSLTLRYLFSEDEYFFLKPEAKLHKVAPPDWKGKVKTGHQPPEGFVVYFRVKFYINSIDIDFLKG